MEKRASIKEFLTSKDFIVSLVITLFFTWISAQAFALPILTTFNIGGIYSIFVIVLLVGAVVKSLRMSPKGQAILWIMLSACLGLGWTAYHTFFGVAWITNWSWTGEWFKPWVDKFPNWMGPSHITNPTFAAQMLIGGASVPWGAWAIPLLFYLFVGLTIFLLQISLATILRKQFVDVEKLTFPYGVGATSMVTAFKPEAESSSLKRWVLIGILVGIISQVGSIQGLIWPGHGWSWFDAWGTTNYTIPGLPNSAIKLMIIPSLVALNYLAPVEVLFSIVLIGFVWWDVLPAVWVWIGTAPVLSADPGWSPDSQYYASLGPGWLAHAAPFMYGAMLGLGLIYLFFTRKSWAVSFRTFLNKISGKEEPEEGKGENYTFAWIGLLVSALCLIVIYSVVGWAPYVAPLIVLELALWFIAALRIRGEFTPWSGVYWENHGSSNGLFIPLIGTFPGGWGSSANVTGMWFNSYVHGGLIQDPANGPTIGAVMEGYKLGGAHDIPRSHILVGVAVGLALAYVVGLVTTAGVVYSKGINNMGWSWDGMGLDQLGIWFTTGTSDATARVPSTYNFAPDTVSLAQTFGNFFAGAIGVVLLTVLRSAVPAIALHPLGLILGVSQNMYWNFFMVVVAFVLKFATLRIGGAKTYEKIGVPLAIGLVTGAFLTGLVTSWAGALI